MNDEEMIGRDFEAGDTLWYKGVPFRVVNKATLEGPAGNWEFADADTDSAFGDYGPG